MVTPAHENVNEKSLKRSEAVMWHLEVLTIIPCQLLLCCHLACCEIGNPVVVVVWTLDFHRDIQEARVSASMVDEPRKGGRACNDVRLSTVHHFAH